jgi:hypothetical protein
MATEIKPILKSTGAALLVLGGFCVFFAAEAWILGKLSWKTLLIGEGAVVFILLTCAFYDIKFRPRKEKP